MVKVYAGLDAGSSSCHLVGTDVHGEVMHDKKFMTSERNLVSAFESLPGKVHVHLEASGMAGWIQRVLRERVRHVVRVLVSHPKSNAWIAKDPLKSDRVDAYKLAELLRTGHPREVYYAQEDHRTFFKQVVQHYDDVTDQETKIKLKIKARLRAQGVLRKGNAVYTREGREEALAKVVSPAVREAIGQLYEILDHTLEAQKKALHLMRREARRYPEIARFREVPGVGVILACRFSAYIQTPHRFSSKRKLWRYCRLGVTNRSSDGKPLGRKALDRNGNGRLKDFSRKAFNGASRTLTDNAFSRAYRASLSRTHDKTHARLSTQRKIVATLLAMWKGGTHYKDDTG